MCQIEFDTKREDARFCSSKCFGMSQRCNKIKLVCYVCKKEFEREDYYVKRLEDINICFCSRSCQVTYINENRYEKRLLKCLNCGKELILNESDRKEKYCSNECYIQHDKERLAEQCRKIGEENKEIIGQKAKERFKDKENHPFYGRKHSEKSLKKMSIVKKEYFLDHDSYWKGKHLSDETKKKIRDTRSSNWVNGKYINSKRFCWVKGKYLSKKMNKEFIYRSSWELAYMKYLDENNDVISYESESIRLPYYDTENHIRYYIPDFIVKFKDKIEMQEIKPIYFLYSMVNKYKFKAAKDYCKQNNLRFRVITEKYLKRLQIIE